MGRAVGIDVGTTNSVIAAMEGSQQPQVIPNTEGSRTTPSVVAGPDGAVRFSVHGKLYAPEEISAQILRRLADDAGKALGERVSEAVITMPASTSGTPSSS
jgi:molecular chaperone DnaK